MQTLSPSKPVTLEGFSVNAWDAPKGHSVFFHFNPQNTLINIIVDETAETEVDAYAVLAFLCKHGVVMDPSAWYLTYKKAHKSCCSVAFGVVH